MVKQQNNQPFIGVSTVTMKHLVKLGEALFNLVKRGFPFPRFWARFARKPHPRSLSRRCRCHLPTENPSVRIAGAIGTSVQDRIGNTEATSSSSSIEPLQTHKMAYNYIWFTWFPTWSLGNFQFAPGEGCGVELRQKLPPLTACFTIITAKPGTNRTFQFVKVFLRLDETIHTAKSQNRTQEKFTRHDFGWPR